MTITSRHHVVDSDAFSCGFAHGLYGALNNESRIDARIRETACKDYHRGLERGRRAANVTRLYVPFKK